MEEVYVIENYRGIGIITKLYSIYADDSNISKFQRTVKSFKRISTNGVRCDKGKTIPSGILPVTLRNAVEYSLEISVLLSHTSIGFYKL